MTALLLPLRAESGAAKHLSSPVDFLSFDLAAGEEFSWSIEDYFATTPPEVYLNSAVRQAQGFEETALAIGAALLFSQVAGALVDPNGNVSSYLAKVTTLSMAICLSYWIAANLVVNAQLGWEQDQTVDRSPGTDERDLQRLGLFTVGGGLDYYQPCFGSFGLLMGIGLVAGIGNQRFISEGGTSTFDQKNAAWRLTALGHFGAWYVISSYMIFAQWGLLAYQYDRVSFGESGGYSRDSALLLGLNTKAFLVGVKFLLNSGRFDAVQPE